MTLDLFTTSQLSPGPAAPKPRPSKPPGDLEILRWTWHGIKNRCLDERTPGFKHYGGRGIHICDRWLDFKLFAEDMGVRPRENLPSGRSRWSIDRIDVNGNYEPGNCRWATTETQKRNRTDNRWLTLGDRTMIAADWAKELGLSTALIAWRFKQGWSVDLVLSLEKCTARREADNPRTKMTWDIARAIRESNESALALAARFEISDSLVAQVRLNQRWVGPLAPAREGVLRVDLGKKLTHQQASEIRRRSTAGEDMHKIAAEFSVGWSTVHMILTGKTWKKAP